MEEHKPQEYASYNGLSRIPMLKGIGIPFMPALLIFTITALVGFLIQILYGPIGLLALTPMIPVFIFFRIMCENDDRAITMLLLQAKWVGIKLLSGNSKFFGNTFTLLPTKFGRQISDYKRRTKETNNG
jgi:type IV secretion system protein VirB3